ncbi:PfkB family carbohydrate kinase [Paraflavitalea sp. CAU 1676]|uniref:bifunctional heptose 7-phosphate kinase/heptose 1-phosphate adenyltransferase n=1 Tax=Paraflavitalea sp. CAU 1676 TaxID=3032598 RepID=UPI0023D9CB8B|nr:PfkB family carbohydrate kinase [Paraflavitalea sp. CAU 1676]MDF2189808.1 PfkB family carbohydrate kinase [Paraflavitalea sp. CAU 1676]
MSGVNFDKLFAQFEGIKVGVIGDVMLDTYWWGHVDRISPEAPVPVVALDKREYRIGGAGNVALNLVSLGAQVAALSVTGADDDGQLLNGLFEEAGIKTSYLLQSASRITTNKVRIISRNQQMMRLDSETTKDLAGADEQALLKQVERYILEEKPQAIVLEDYNKGVLTEQVIKSVIALCKQHDVITTVDPKRKNFFAYEGVDIFKPNMKEVKDGLNLLVEDVNLNTLTDIHRKLQEKLGHQISFITLSEKGVFYHNHENARIIPSHLRNIADVSGAGDTVIAVASLIYTATKSIELMAQVANIAGGLVCEEVGTVAINKEKLLNECKVLLG